MDELRYMWPDEDRRHAALAGLQHRIDRTERPASLSPQQVRCLQAAALGMRWMETGDILGIDHLTVARHLKEARYRLGAKNTTHAVTLAFRAGLIH